MAAHLELVLKGKSGGKIGTVRKACQRNLARACVSESVSVPERKSLHARKLVEGIPATD
jgi:hypothetical protein